MKVLVFPRDVNPYQSLLYSAMHKEDIEIQYIAHSPRGKVKTLLYTPNLIWEVLQYRLSGFKILHIHWLYTFDLPEKVPFGKRITRANIRIFLCASKILGFRIVWTVHNILPHESQSDSDIKLVKYISKITDIKIVHSKSTLSRMIDMGLNTDNIHVIAHGNYINVYPTKETYLVSRMKLRINKGDFVLLFFGLVRPYKGIEELIEAFSQIDSSGVRLIIAGRCTDENLRHKIKQASNNLPIDFYDRYIPNDEAARYFNACDAVCLPFRDIYTSGSSILAISFGKPIIAPRIGPIKDIPSGAGILYNPKIPDALINSLMRAIKADASLLNKMGRASESYAKTLSWDKSAKKTFDLYLALLNPDKNVSN